MAEDSAYKKILRYIDDLNASVSSLACTVENQMAERGYVPIPSVNSKCYWYLSPNYDAGSRWRLKMVTRFYIPEHEARAKLSESVVYQVLLDTSSAFAFPTVLCARVSHDSLTEADIVRYVWNSDTLATLHTESARWQHLADTAGWCKARPTRVSRVHSLCGYLLSLYDIDTPERAFENIALPLTELPLGPLALTVPHYPFPRPTGGS